MVIYGSPPPRKRGRRGRRTRRHRLPRWARWTLATLGLILVCVLAAGGYELWYLNSVYNKVTKLHGTDRKASTHLAPNIPTSSQPVTALLIGSDHRADGATGKNGLSDTLMLARLDPKHHIVSLLSIPRDLWVGDPNGAGQKINSYYSEGGDNASLEAVEQVTGIKPNYLLNVDFAGFRRLVDTLGGIYVNVDQYYYNPASVEQSSGFSAIDVKPGYQKLNGVNALAFSRYRHTDDDFHRQARQQTFLRAFEARAADRFHGISVRDIPFINDILGALSNSVTIVGPGKKAPSPRTLLSFAATAYEARSNVASIHLNYSSFTAPDGEDAVQVTDFPQAISQWRHPWLLKSATTGLPAGKHKHTAKPWQPAVTPATVKLSVLNGNGLAGAAGKTASALHAWGYRTTSGNAPAGSYTTTWAYYRPGWNTAAADLVRILGNASAAPMPNSVRHVIGAHVDIAVVIGPGFKGRLAVQAPPKHPAKPAGPPATITTTTQYRADFVHAANTLHFPVLYPTVAQANSTFCPWVPTPAGPGQLTCQGTSTTPIRLYGIGAAGKGWNSMYAVFSMPAGGLVDYWGIEETKFVDAPILKTPNATRVLGGRKYLFFVNGSHIQTIAFIENGAAYWVENTLLDDLTNPEMVAIARSLKPVK
jgi:LCP family protein required for cell wall assembly